MLGVVVRLVDGPLQIGDLVSLAVSCIVCKPCSCSICACIDLDVIYVYDFSIIRQSDQAYLLRLLIIYEESARIIVPSYGRSIDLFLLDPPLEIGDRRFFIVFLVAGF